MINNQAQAVDTVKRRDILTLLQSDDLKRKVAAALPRHMTADRMLRVMATTLNAPGYVGEKLRSCTPESLIACLMKCSQYGLEPDGRHAHLIPYGDQCTLIFDYKGLVNLVRRSGEVKTIHADVVYEGDDFSFAYGSNAHLDHKPTLNKQTRGVAVAAYSFVVCASGEESFEVLPIFEVEDVRDKSQGFISFKNGKAKQSPWADSFGEMAKKTAFRRHSKWLPLSFELQEALNADDDKSTEEERFRTAKPVFSSPPSELPEPRPEPAQEFAERATRNQPVPAVDNTATVPVVQTDLTAKSAKPNLQCVLDWLSEKKFTWSQVQPILVSEDVFPDADSVAGADDLSETQARKVFAARNGIEAVLKGGAK